jgi:hypothetical protein
MKNNQFKIRAILVWMAFLIFTVSSCGGDDSLTPEELRLQELTATWAVSSVVNDGSDVTRQFAGFILTVSGTQTYSTVNGGNAWPAQGTFTLVTNNLDAFLRDDNVQVNIVDISDTALTLTFQINTVRGTVSGVNGITGSFTFNLTKTN